MKFQPHFHHTRTSWLKKPYLSYSMQSWLIDTGSLTARLQKRYVHFAVKPVLVKYAKPIPDESGLLHLPAYKTALIREVLLIGDYQPRVFAHSVLPKASLRGAWNKLGKIGNKPLGATLFANPAIKRSQFTYKKLARHHPISIRLAAHLQLTPTPLWARRSLFSLNCAKILVTEVFLPRLLK